MTAFGEKVELIAAPAHRLADQLFALAIALGGIDDIEPGIEGAA